MQKQSVCVRLTAEQKAIIKQAADINNVTFSGFVAKICEKEAKKVLKGAEKNDRKIHQ